MSVHPPCLHFGFNALAVRHVFGAEDGGPRDLRRVPDNRHMTMTMMTMVEGTENDERNFLSIPRPSLLLRFVHRLVPTPTTGSSTRGVQGPKAPKNEDTPLTTTY